jgi:hypothetical protein
MPAQIGDDEVVSVGEMRNERLEHAPVDHQAMNEE